MKFEKYENVEFIVKRNPRRESPSRWLDLAKNVGREIPQREGKRTWIGQTKVGLEGQNLPCPIVFKITERTVKKGQMLAFPEIKTETYWCSLERMPPEEAIELYHDHGTSEQFHSEIKTDMGVERLPSVHFETNDLTLHLTALAYNMLRIVGQLSLEHSAAMSAPEEKPEGKRRPPPNRNRDSGSGSYGRTMGQKKPPIPHFSGAKQPAQRTLGAHFGVLEDKLAAKPPRSKLAKGRTNFFPLRGGNGTGSSKICPFLLKFGKIS